MRPQAERHARAPGMLERGLPLPLPPLDAGAHLVAALMECGPCMQGLAGPVALSWGEVAAWQRCTGATLQPWEARLVRALSAEWVAEARLAEKDGAASPLQRAATPTPEQRERISRGLGAALAAMAQPDPRRRKAARS